MKKMMDEVMKMVKAYLAFHNLHGPKSYHLEVAYSRVALEGKQCNCTPMNREMSSIQTCSQVKHCWKGWVLCNQRWRIFSIIYRLLFLFLGAPLHCEVGFWLALPGIWSATNWDRFKVFLSCKPIVCNQGECSYLLLQL